jgi:hypothetical protein
MCDTDHCLAVPEVKGRMSVIKWNTQKFDMEKFNLKKLNKVEGKVKISNRFAVLKNSDADLNINRTYETVRENIKMLDKVSLGYYGFKQHKPWIDEGCSKLLDQRKQANLHSYRIQAK